MQSNRIPIRALSAFLSLVGLLAGAVAAQEGHLLLIGGGKRPEAVMRHFVELAGGPSRLFLIVPTASEDKNTGRDYIREFRQRYGCGDVRELKLLKPEDAQGGEWETLLPRTAGIFFTGGDQRRIVRVLRGTPFAAALRQAYERGAVIGGTSAGTACMSPVMLTGDGDPAVIRARNIIVWEGLGLFPGVILDQHFVARQRTNRLIATVLEHPDLVGIGIDERTAVWLKPDGELEVLGDSVVLVVDARGIRPVTDPTGNIGGRDLRLHVLLPGDRYRVAGTEIRSVR